MQGGNILQTIIDNKKRIEYVREVFEDTGSYWRFKFKSKQKNIFGLNKCFYIEVYDNPKEYKNDTFEMYLRLPFHCYAVEIPYNAPEAKKISEILYDVYFKAEYNDDIKVWKSVGKLLKGCRYKED